MDNPGWHAQRRAKREEELYNMTPYRGPDGRYHPIEQVAPMDESFIGGFHVHPPQTPPPPLPPKDFMYTQPNYRVKPPSEVSTISSSELTHMTAVERSRALRTTRMEPHLQFMCGPLLRYDTVDAQGVWRGAALIVTADSSSIYEPHPTLTYDWDPDARVAHTPHAAPSPNSTMKTHKRERSRTPSLSLQHHGPTFDLGPHPADPHSTILAASPTKSSFVRNGKAPMGPNARSETSFGQEIWVYGGDGGTCTFWRFLIQVPLGEHEMMVTYNINNGQQMEFCVPGRNQNMRWAAHSCNGFSAGVNPDDFRGPGFKSGYDPVWMDLLSKHNAQPFHVLVGGGDQLYCDAITREPELQEWVSTSHAARKREYPLTEEISQAIDRFYFNHYCHTFRSGAFARANSSIPMVNMADDHDLIDGFGSYPDELQMSPIFRAIGSRGYFFFLLFQCFINDELDGTKDSLGSHVNLSIIIGGPGAYVPFPSHSFLTYLGPHTYLLMLDCRAERRKEEICSQVEYRKMFHRINQLPAQVEHLVIQLGVPIAYPRMVFLESALESKFNPLVALGRNGSLGLTGFVNKFNAEAELLDDLNDHWTARSHKRERNWFIEELQKFALQGRKRVTFLSGDVHCGAVGVLKTLKSKGKQEVVPRDDHRYMLNVVTSAIVNTPPPNGVITMVSSLASKVHKTLHHIDTDETMLPIFVTDTNGSPRKQKFIMGKRNWCQVDYDAQTGDLVFDLRVEIRKGYGETVGYVARAPPPAWTPFPPRQS